jgi:hypothetical protein
MGNQRKDNPLFDPAKFDEKRLGPIRMYCSIKEPVIGKARFSAIYANMRTAVHRINESEPNDNLIVVATTNIRNRDADGIVQL